MRTLLFLIFIILFHLGISNTVEIYVWPNTLSIHDDLPKEILDKFESDNNSFLLYKGIVPNLGVATHPYWCVIPIGKHLEKSDFLEISNPHIDTAALYLVDYNNQIEYLGMSGDKVEIAKWAFPALVPTFEISNISRAKLLIVKLVKNGALRIPISFKTERETALSEMKFMQISSIYLGFLVLAGFLGLGLFIAFRKWIYFFYLLYAISFFVLMFIEFGFAYQYVSFVYPYDISFIRTLSGTLNSIALINFVRLFLRIQQHQKWLNISILAHSFLLVFQILFFFAWPKLVLRHFDFIVPWYFLMLIVSAFLIMLCIGFSYKKYPTESTFMGLTFSMVIIGSFIIIGLEMNILPHNAFTNNALAYSSALELLLISGAISKRLANIYKARLNLQKQLVAEKKLRILDSIKGEEQERRRLARELHDSIGAYLLAAKLKIVGDNVQEAQQIIQMAHTELRNISHQLLPPQVEKQSLTETFHNYLASNFSQNKIQFTLVDNSSGNEMSTEQKITLYRVLQEAISNAVKHGAASEIQIEVSGRNQFHELKISDNGIGFQLQTQKMGLGIQNLKSRVEELGGYFNLITSPNQGTSITAGIPF